MERIEPHIPPEPPKPKGGRPPVAARAGAERDTLRAQDGYPVGTSASGDGLRLRHDLLASPTRLAGRRRLAEDLADVAGRTGANRRDRLVHLGDGQLLGPRPFWGPKPARIPQIEARTGSKRHLMVDGQGTPLVVEHTGANVHDSEMAIALVDGFRVSSNGAVDHGRGRDTDCSVPPAQIPASGTTALGSYLGCLAKKRTLGYGCSIVGLGIQSPTSFPKRFHVIRNAGYAAVRRATKRVPLPAETFPGQPHCRGLHGN